LIDKIRITDVRRIKVIQQKLSLHTEASDLTVVHRLYELIAPFDQSSKAKSVFVTGARQGPSLDRQSLLGKDHNAFEISDRPT
jgi:hypothetical protein